MEKIKLSQAVIVEGKYDKIKLSSFLDANIICTDGFAIFKDTKKMKMIKEIADKRGIIIITDSDSAGFLIRSHLTGSINNDKIINVYIPEIFGKEKRKNSPSAEGLLGVEGVSIEIIRNSLERAGVLTKHTVSQKSEITHTDLYNLGLLGKSNSKEKRQKFLFDLDLPKKMSTNQLLTALNALYSREEFQKIAERPTNDE